MRKSIHSEPQAHLAALLVEARNRAKLTQEELAKRVGRPQSFVSKYETGERRLDVVEFIDVAREIGADPVSLLRRLIRDKGL